MDAPPGNPQRGLETLLGGSIIGEEHKGNFKQAREFAEALLERAKGGDVSPLLADALTARGLVHVLQGEPGAACACLDQVPVLVPEDPDRNLLASSYALLAAHAQYNTFPDRNGAGATDIELRWNIRTDMLPLIDRWERLVQQAKDPETQERAQTVDLLCRQQSARSMLQNARCAQLALVEPILQNFLGTTERVRTAALARRRFALAAFADLAASDLCRRSGAADPIGFLNRAKATYGHCKDSAGLADCVMLRADWRCAPASTPLALDCVLQASATEANNLPGLIESAELVPPPSPVALPEARIACYRSRRIFEEAKAPRGVAAATLRLGYLAALEGSMDGAIDHARQAMRDFEACEDWLGMRTAQAHWVAYHIHTDRFADVLETAAALGTWGKTSGSFSFALGLGILFTRFARHCLIRDGSYERALTGARAAQALFEALGAEVSAAQSLVDQGNVYDAVGDVASAVLHYENAIERYTAVEQGDPGVRAALRQRATMAAAQLYELYQGRMDAKGMELASNRLCSLSRQLAPSIEQAPAVREDDPGLVGEWACRQYAHELIAHAAVLVPLYRARQAKQVGEASAAAGFLDEASKALEQVDEQHRAFAEVAVMAERKEFDKAAQARRRQLEQAGHGGGFADKLLEMLKASGSAHGDAELRQQEFRVEEESFLTFVRVKAYADAVQHLTQMERLAGKNWWMNDPRPWQALSDCAEMHAGLGDLERAAHTYDQAIEQFEQRRGKLSHDELRTAFGGDMGVQYLYFQAASVAARGRHFGRAYDYAERSKARALLDLMTPTRALGPGAGIADREIDQWRKLNGQLTAWRNLAAQERRRQYPDATLLAQLATQIQSAGIEIGALEARLAQSHPDFFRAFSAQAPVLNIDQVSAQLAADELLLQYFFVGEELLGWAISSTGLEHAFSAPLDPVALARDIRGLHHSWEKRLDEGAAGMRLSATLLAPFEKAIDAHRDLIVVPYGDMHLLPFQAFPWHDGRLYDSHALRYLPSASVLQFLHGPFELRERILAVGNPAAMSYCRPGGREVRALSSLANAEIEAKTVGELFSQGKALIGEQATKQAVVQSIPDFPLLHFATHGCLSEESPLLSSIALANGEVLSAYELIGLGSKPDLVVLSACETARGQLTRGDEVLGLTRALLAAGARAAVVSLWQVDDVSTGLLMGEFYRRLLAHTPPAQALRAAQQYLRSRAPDTLDSKARSVRHISSDAGPGAGTADYSHPYYWAPFVLVGCG